MAWRKRFRIGSSRPCSTASVRLFAQGLTTAERMAAARWEDRTRILNRAGYARYDESTSRKPGDCSRMLIDRYRGLRLRKPHQLSRLLENLLKEELRLRP